LALSESFETPSAALARSSQPPHEVSAMGEQGSSASSSALLEAPRRLSNPPPKPSRPVSRAALRNALSNLDEPSPPTGVDLRVVLGAPPGIDDLAFADGLGVGASGVDASGVDASGVDASGVDASGVDAGAEQPFETLSASSGPGPVNAAPAPLQDEPASDESASRAVHVLDGQVQASMLSLAHGEIRHGLLGLAEAARSARKLGPERACGARLSLAAGLVKAGCPREALAEALEAYGYAVSAEDESLQRACGKLLLQLSESHGSTAAAQAWREVVAPSNGSDTGV
jgi:hypothetical protein